MRILMVIDSFYPWVGGSETAVVQLSNALSRMGHEVGVAVMSRPEARNPSNEFKFWLIPSTVGPFELKFLGKIRNLRKIIREFKPDVMNVHFMLESGYVGVTAARKEGIPVVLTNRGKGLYNEPMVFWERVLYPFWNNGSLHADRYIATSQEMVDMAKEKYGIESLAISNGVDIDHFTPGKDGASIRRKHGATDSRRVLLCVRRLVPKNGIEYIIRALPEIRKKHDAVLWLASPLIREYEVLKVICNELGIEQYVHFLGSVEHDVLPQYFAAADVVVQPSIAEARSLACLEAMASGAAVVATATGGLKELITHRDNGYLVPEFQQSTYAVTGYEPEGVQRLAAAVIDVLSDEPLRKHLQERARAYAVAEASWPIIAKQTLKVYEEAIAAHSSSHA
jgi:glycosyltransferase involved in cell wall biosynthesis